MKKIVMGLGICLILIGCTFSFNNISTNGKASDVLKEQQSTSPVVSPDIEIPLTQ